MMTTKMSAPKINNKFFCIVSQDKPTMAAIISSYICGPSFYTPTFQFPQVTAPEINSINDNTDPEHQWSRVLARKTNVKLGNSIRRIGGCEYLVVAGLSTDQLSYLTFPNDYNTIYIDSIEEIDIFLIHIADKHEILSCPESKLIEYLPLAINDSLILKIDENAHPSQIPHKNESGVVIIEETSTTSGVIAVNYAMSIGARVEQIEKIELNRYEIRSLIEDWKNGVPNAGNDLSAVIYPTIEHISFHKYDFATFFTHGVPFSLIIKNIIPVSHVHLHINPDFFIFNSIFFESHSEPYSAIVFSPKEFNDEETEYVIKCLEENEMHVKQLTGNLATVFNLDNHIQHYPYSVFHICSHGGEIEGHRITEELLDRDNRKHIIEYHEVITLGINPYEDSHPLSIKRFIKSFDGLKWRSKPLKESVPQYVFADILEGIGNGKELERTKISSINGSCNIKCHDHNYQAMFNYLAASHSPLVFNNTCWSWSDICDSFLGVGARGYIGTLWAVNNLVAKNSAELFYSNLFEGTILDAFYKCLSASNGTENENIYLYWGLHFSTAAKGISIPISRKIVLSKIMESIEIWRNKLAKTVNEKHMKTIKGIIEWMERTLVSDFKKELIAKMNEIRNEKDSEN